MPVIKPLVGSSEAPQQYKQPSRKGKKAWRKNVDVSEVEKGLAQLNEEIIKGGVIAEKASHDLFTVDVVGDPSKSKSRNLPRHIKNLKADEIISQRSAISAVSIRKRPGDNTPNGVFPEKRQRTNYVTHKELTRLRKVADGQHETTVVVEDATYDVWDIPAEEIEPVITNQEKAFFLPKPSRKKVPKTLHQAPISLTASGKPVPAVPKPKGGYSYNPAFSDYENRLMKESAQAVEAERKRLEALEADRLKQEAAARSAAEAEAAERRADLSEWDEDSAWEGFESGGEELLSVKAKRPERKTQAQRNRIKRRKEEERREKHEAAMKRKNAQAERIKEIAEAVEEREQALALEKMELSDASSDEADDEADKLRRRQLGKFKLPQKDLELVLPDELQDSLRLLKPEGNLLKDRYRSLLVRGKLEARRKIPFRKQAKKKLTEKWTYKDFRLD